jgi:hypothetical protein
MLLNCHLVILHYLQQYEKIKKPLISERPVTYGQPLASYQFIPPAISLSVAKSIVFILLLSYEISFQKSICDNHCMLIYKLKNDIANDFIPPSILTFVLFTSKQFYFVLCWEHLKNPISYFVWFS